jgi:hypothetical protein
MLDNDIDTNGEGVNTRRDIGRIVSHRIRLVYQSHRIMFASHRVVTTLNNFGACYHFIASHSCRINTKRAEPRRAEAYDELRDEMPPPIRAISVGEVRILTNECRVRI